MKLFERWKDKLLRRKTFFKMFIYFIMACLMILSVSTYYLYTLASNSIVEEIGNHTEDSLQKTAAATSYMLDWSLSYAQQWSRDPQLVAYAFNKKNDPYEDYRLWTALRKITANNPLIESIYMVNEYTKTVVDSRSGVYAWDEFYDPASLELIEPDRMNTGSKFIPRNVSGLLNSIMPINQNVVTYIFPYEPNISVSTLVVNFSEKSILDLIGRSFSQIDSTYMLVDGDNRIVASLDPDQFLTTSSYSSQIEHTDAASGWTEIKSQNNELLLSYANLSVLGHDDWKIITAIPIKQLLGTLITLKNWTLLFYIPVVILTLFIVWALANRIYFPIQRLLKDIEIEKVWPRHGQYENELSVVSEVYREQQTHLKRLDHTWKQYRSDARNHLLKDLVMNHQSNELHDLIERMQEVGLRVPSSDIRLVLISIDYYKDWSAAYNEQEIRLLRYALVNVIEEECQNYYSNAVELDHDLIALVIGGMGQSEGERLLDLLNKCQSSITGYLHIQASFTASPALHSILELPAAYSKALAQTELKFFIGAGRIQIIDDQEQSAEESSYYYAEDIERKVINNLNLAYTDETMHYIDSFFASLPSSNVSEAQLSIIRLTLSIGKSVDGNISEMKRWNTRFIQDKMNQLQTMDSYQAWLKEQLKLYLMKQKAQAQRPNRNKQLVSDIAKLIDQNLGDQNLSTKWIADQMQMSTNYLRAVFKEETGQPLADYITKQRLEQIVKLLVDTNRTVEDISLNNGFSAVNSFYVAFKKAYGMTPIHYRKLYQQAQKQ